MKNSEEDMKYHVRDNLILEHLGMQKVAVYKLDSTSGSIHSPDEYNTPTSIVEQNLEQMINEKYKLLLAYFKQGVELSDKRFEQHQKLINIQSEQINALMTESNLQKLNRIAKYEDNWNGEGTQKIDKKIILNTRDILFATSLNRQPKLFPSNNNTIQLEYEENNKYLEIEVLNDKYVVYSDINGRESEAEFKSLEEVIRVLNEF